MIITFAIDFDGTCVEHMYPDIGPEVPYAVLSLQHLVASGHRLILNTMRHDHELDAAVHWFEENDIELFGVNHNPEQDVWTTSPKVYANKYIDDAAVGCPLRPGIRGSRPMVHWPAIMHLLQSAS